MADLRAVPPGRSGRLWLRERLTAARRAADLMDRKVRVLREQRDRSLSMAGHAEAEWRRAALLADRWLFRAGMLGGERELRLCAATTPAEVTVSWASVMGVHCPVEATCHLPEPAAGERGPGSAALVEAAAACRGAVCAAAAHATAAASVRALDRELARTRRRLRALTTGRIPRLEAALVSVTAELEESERAELVRLRWAVAHQSTVAYQTIGASGGPAAGQLSGPGA